MKLKDIPLTDPVDLMYLQQMRNQFRAKQREGRLVDGVCKIGIYVGPDYDSPLFCCKTKGEEEYVLFLTFLAKIRRENIGVEEASLQKQRAWYDMSKAFIDEFGEERTPPDVISANSGCKKHLGI